MRVLFAEPFRTRDVDTNRGVLGQGVPLHPLSPGLSALLAFGVLLLLDTSVYEVAESTEDHEDDKALNHDELASCDVTV